MTPTKHPLCNDVLRRPAGMTEAECGDLPIYRIADQCQVASFWQPDADELAALNAGSPVVLIVAGVTHPPVNVEVLQPEAVEALSEKSPADHAR